MTILTKYGLTDFFTKQLTNVKELSLVGKVIYGGKKRFKVITEVGEINCLIKGSMIHHKVSNNSLLPKVGDFVLLDSKEDLDSNKTYFINRILTRKSELKRKLVAKRPEDQIIVSNIDYAFITVSCDDQFNIRKIERLVIACVDGNVTPIFVITKTDLTNDVNFFVEQLQQAFANIQIIITSILEEDSIREITDILKDNKNGAFIGSSGVGKSTLTNMILKHEAQKTLGVSEEKSKGRHTTTHRELFLLESGGCIIDNPGIKEFGLWVGDETTILSGFQDILYLSKQCKFSNCSHTNEPSCKVIEALSANKLSLEKYQSFIKLQQEQQKDVLHYRRHEKTKQNKTAKKTNKDNKFNKNPSIDDYE